MEYKLISGDGHIDLRWLPHDLFVTDAPARWKDQVPKVVETDKGKSWFMEGKDLSGPEFGELFKMMPPPRGLSKRFDKMYDVGFFDGRPHPTTPELRIKDQEIDGVDAEVIYGVLGMGRYVDNRDLLTVIYQTYNTWVADFCKSNPQRLAGLACLPNHDPQVAANELHRAAKLGLRGVDFDVASAVKPLWHRHWDPLWAASDETGVPISFHASGSGGVGVVRKPSDEQMAKEYATEYAVTLVTMFQLAGAEYLPSIIVSGAPERYPGFKFVLGECGATWIPYVLSRLDEEYEDHAPPNKFPLKPSEYWYRQGFTSFQHEPSLADVVQLVGEDNIIWGSDYPHQDGIWPDSRETIEADLGRLDEKVRRKITCENARKLYRLVN